MMRRAYLPSLLLVLCLAWTARDVGGAPSAKPLAEADVIKLLELQIDDGTIIAKITAGGIGFTADEQTLGRLKQAGGSDVLLAAIKKAAAQPKPAAGPTVSYEDITKLLQLGIPDTAIIERLRKSPTVFVLDAKQIAELKGLGASDALLAAMQGARPSSKATAEIVTDLAIILDCSGSMREQTKDGQAKMAAAKRVLTDLIRDIPDGLNLTFVIYGHEVFGAGEDYRNCQAVKIARPLSVLDASGKAELSSLIASLNPTGATPIALALRTAGQELARRDAFCGLVLITDGLETCQGDPTAEAARLAANPKLTFGVNVVGFDVNEQESQSLARIAAAGKGKYFNADSAAELDKSIGSIATQLQEVAKPAPAVASNRRALKILPPGIKLPPMKMIAIIAADGFGPEVASNYSPVVESKKYGEEIRLPSAKEYDVLWVPEQGRSVYLLRHYAIKERKLIEIKPEDYLGLVRVGGSGLPKPRIVAVTAVGAFGPDVPSNFNPVQIADGYGTDMAVPVGKYDVWMQPADGGKTEKLEEELVVKAGEASVLD